MENSCFHFFSNDLMEVPDCLSECHTLGASIRHPTHLFTGTCWISACHQQSRHVSCVQCHVVCTIFGGWTWCIFFSKTSSFFGYLAAAQVTRTLLTVTPRKAREAWTPSKQGAVGVILSKSKNLPVPLVGQRPPKYHNDTSQVGIAFAYEGDQGMFIRDMYIYIYM